VEIAMHCY